MSVLDRVRRTIRDRHLARPDTRVAVALSGGSDSVALAHLVRDLASEGALKAAGAVHFHHGLRATADRDQRFAESVAASLGWPFLCDREDVRARAQRERRSIEDAARAARYEFLERARVQLHADVVALGHTRDDQAETFLLRLLRGAGPRGLGGMRPRRGVFVRPLLECRRRELRAYLEERRIAYVDDESNEDVAIARNRIRAELIPFLETRFNPGIVDVLADEAEIARGVWEWMDAAADELDAGRPIRTPGESGLELDIERLMSVPPPLRRLVVWRAMTTMSGGRHISFDHVQAAMQLIEPGAGPAVAGGVDAPGHRVQRNGARLVLTNRRLNSPSNLFWYRLSIPGEVRLAEAGVVVSAEVGSTAGRWPEPGTAGGPRPDHTTAIVRRDVCRLPLAVRNRRPGDRFRPLGLGGRKKLQDYFVDRKVPRGNRDLVPLIVDGGDQIVWVAGHGIAEEFRVTDPAQGVLILRLKHVGGLD